MKRSYINQKIKEAIEFFDEMKFLLPPWGYWKPDQWNGKTGRCREIIDNRLGWDLTDFGSGNFEGVGLLLFTIRNGKVGNEKKTYAEKIMIVEEEQVTPMHFHWSKMEDIINRGGGNLMIQLYPSEKDGSFADHGFKVSVDGFIREFNPGDILRLLPGESVTLHHGLYHKFYGEKGCGKVLVGEVSAVNDDHSDNHFYEKYGRFPDIEEDEPPLHLLNGDYNNISL